MERSTLAALLGLGLLACGMAQAGATRKAPPLPAEAKRWVGAPQSWERLRGRVVLLDVWTFG